MHKDYYSPNAARISLASVTGTPVLISKNGNFLPSSVVTMFGMHCTFCPTEITLLFSPKVRWAKYVLPTSLPSVNLTVHTKYCLPLPFLVFTVSEMDSIVALIAFINIRVFKLLRINKQG